MNKLVIAMTFATLVGGTAAAQPDNAMHATGDSPSTAGAPSPTDVGPPPEKVGPPPENVGPPPEKVAPIEGRPPGPEPAAIPLTPEREKKASVAEAVGGEPGEHVEEDPDPTRHFNYTNFSYRGKDEYGGPFGDGVEIDPQGHKLEEEPMSAPFILMLVNFGILLIILGKYGGPVARKLAKDRHDQIKNALDEAAKLRKQAADKLAEYEKRIKDVDLEIKKLVDGIRTDAENDKVRILNNAEVQAAQLKREAEQRIAAEIELARAALKKEVTAAASSATEKLLREKVTQDDQTRLVSTFIAGVEGSTASPAAKPPGKEIR